MRKLTIPSLAFCLVASGASLADEPNVLRLKEPAYCSEHPLYFRVAFGSSEGRSMLGVLDEGDGAGKGYTVAYIDENMNNDLTDDPPKKFPLPPVPSDGRAPSAPTAVFSFKGPFGEKGTAEYRLDLSSIANQKVHVGPGRDCDFGWMFTTDGHRYMFITGTMTLHAAAAEALKGRPMVLAGECKWEIGSRTGNGEVIVSAALKDENGCTLRVVSERHRVICPIMTLIKDGQKMSEQQMEYG